jgi:hypothetical protein
VPYRRTPRSRLSYRRSAYLLTTDRSTPAIQLLQVYLDRWEIVKLILEAVFEADFCS